MVPFRDERAGRADVTARDLVKGWHVFDLYYLSVRFRHYIKHGVCRRVSDDSLVAARAADPVHRVSQRNNQYRRDLGD
jgi:hypothetical protein